MAQLFAHQVAPDAVIDRPDASEPASTRAPDATTDPGPGPDPTEAGGPEHAPHDLVASLPLIALVLGVAGVVLGVTVVWFFAAIPIGLVSVVTGLVARGRLGSYEDPRAASRATIGTALGCVAILLGLTGAYFLPRVMDRADRFLGSIQQDVNSNVNLVNQGLSRDVDRLDRTLTRDLKRFERDNHRDLRDLEDRTAVTLKQLEDRLHGDVDTSRAAAKKDLATLEASLRADLRAAQDEMHTADSTLHDTIAALEARVEAIEHKLEK